VIVLQLVNIDPVTKSIDLLKPLFHYPGSLNAVKVSILLCRDRLVESNN